MLFLSCLAHSVVCFDPGDNFVGLRRHRPFVLLVALVTPARLHRLAFAVVSGVVGAGLSPGIILILGSANLVADGFSMAAGNYSATRTEA